jgi:hypothetical protein
MLSLVAAWLVNIAHFLKLNKSIDRHFGNAVPIG